MAAPRHHVRVGPRFPVRVNIADPYNGAQDNIALGWNLFQPGPIIGPGPIFSVASANYDENGNNIGLNPRIDPGRGLWMGGLVANLFTGDSSQACSVTLTAQAYTLLVWSGSASCSYGTATPGNPLKFTATAGATVFTPTGVSKWLLVAGTFGDMPYVPPGATQPTNAATTGGNGTNIPLDAAMLECFRGKPDGVELRSDLGGMLDNVGTTHTVMSFSTTGIGGLTVGPFPVGNRYRIVVYGYTTSSDFSVNAADKSPSPGSRTLIAAGFGETEWVVQSGFQYFYLRNGSTGTTNITSISIQRLLPAVCTVMAETYMGVGSGDFTSNKSLLSANSSELSVIYFAHDSIAKSYDQTAGTGVFGMSWSANEIHRRYVQTSSDGTKYRVGYQRYTSAMMEITSGIQWSHTGVESTWAAFDGSFNPLTYLRLGLNLSVPIWGRKLLISDKTLTDAEIKNAWEVVK